MEIISNVICWSHADSEIWLFVASSGSLGKLQQYQATHSTVILSAFK